MEINFAEIVAQAIAFCTLLVILRWKAWGPIQQSLKLRRDTIQAEFDKIDQTKKEVEALKSEYKIHLQKIEDEARLTIQQSIEEGRRISKELQDKARIDSQETFEKAKDNLNLEVAKARLMLRRDIADLALSTTERVLNEKMTEDKAQQAKIMAIIEDLEKTL